MEIYINNTTQIDMSYLDVNSSKNECLIKGMSYNLNVSVDGVLETEEQVVEDFSKAKKRIKSLVDASVDHRLVLLTSQNKYFEKYEVEEDKSYYIVKTDNCEVILPDNAVCLIDDTNLGSLEESIVDHIEKLSSTNKVNVYCWLDNSVKVPNFNGNSFLKRKRLKQFSSVGYFQYLHGLQYSSSYGCTNICHGHYSSLSLLLKEGTEFSIKAVSLLQRIIKDINNRFFVNENEISSYTKLDYEIENRGKFTLITDMYDSEKVFLMQKEPTIENMTEHLTKKYAEELKAVGCSGLSVSEGLAKGSYYILEDE